MKKFTSLFLALLLCLSLCVPVFAVQNEGDSFQADPINGKSISELFSLLGCTDGSGTEDLAYELYQTFQSDPSAFIRAATQLSSDELATMAKLLVYFAGYFDMNAFRKQVASYGDDMLTESEQIVVDEILKEINLKLNQTVQDDAGYVLPGAPKYNPYFLEKLISAHVDNNNFEDEEFFETLSKVLLEDPATFSAVTENLSVVARDAIVVGVAKACVKSGNIISWQSSEEFPTNKTDIISAIQQQIVTMSSSISDSDVLDVQEISDPMPAQGPTIDEITYMGELTCGEATTLAVVFSEPTATLSARTYWTEVYAVRDGIAYLKSSKSITIRAGATQTTQLYSITYSDTGEVYTLVKVYSSQGGSLLSQRQGVDPDVIWGTWSIIVSLPVDRRYKGSLSLFHPNGELVNTWECLGLSEENLPMTEPNGNTPTGTYRGNICSAHSNDYSYGPHERINMVGVSGIAKTSGRTGIMIHGGNPTPNTNALGYPLRCTLGCIRVSNADQENLIDSVYSLIYDSYAETYGDVIVYES